MTRTWCLIASLAPDVDGFGLLLGRDFYERFHHVLAHNLLFGGLVTALAVGWIGVRARPLALVFASFLSHLVGDYFGSGPGWGISPYLPFSSHEYLFAYAWDLVSWQNTTISAIAIALTLAVAARRGYTPLETVLPAVDRVVVETLRLRTQTIPCRACGARAWYRCALCGAPACQTHATVATRLSRRCVSCG